MTAAARSLSAARGPRFADDLRIAPDGDLFLRAAGR
jgi:hypothetical protein